MTTTDLSHTTIKPSSIECRFATYSKSKESQDDIHFIKEQVTMPDGTRMPRTRIAYNFERPFYVTNKGNRNHKDHKEWEEKSKLIEFKSTQTKLTSAVANALGTPWARGSLKALCATPYVYGVDITAASIIKYSYMKRWNTVTPYSNAAFDTETDMVNGTGQIVIATLSFKDRVFTAITKDFTKGHSEPIKRINDLMQKHLGEILEKRKIQHTIVLVDKEIDIVKAIMVKAHAWSPDILSVWNLAFDMDKIIAACDRAGIAIEDLLCDPSVPQEYRQFTFKKGAAKKTTASGRVMSFKPSQRWHTVRCPSGFYWLDAMGVYRQVRTGAPEEPSYGLDAILKKHKIGGKLSFHQADHIKGADWHRFMQAKYPLEYVVYNVYDCVSMEILDEKTLDIQYSLPMFAGCTEFENFNSQPKKTMNSLHWFVEKYGMVPGATATEMVTEGDELTTDVSGWIIMLPSHLVADNGLQLIAENPLLKTNIRLFVADLDIEGAYPINGLVMNVSKQTTSKELISISGVPEAVQRAQTINYSGGRTNALEFCNKMFKMPTLDVLLDAFEKQK